MRIGEVASRTNTPASTIRYYERAGVLPEPKRVNQQRVYGEQVLEDLEAIRIAQDLSFSLDEIKALLSEFRHGGKPSQECQSLASQKLEELDQLIRDARRMKKILEHGVTCTCTSLQGCYVAGNGS